jgi:hypothetical protein
MANWLQSWNYDSSSSSSGLTPPTEKQVTDAAMLYAAWMFPMTRMGSAVTGWLARQGAKRIVPPSGLSLIKSAVYQATPAGAVVQMGKGTVSRIVAHKMGMYKPLSQSSEGSSPSYQQNGSSGGKQKVSSLPKGGSKSKPDFKLIRGTYPKFTCSPGYVPINWGGKMVCIRKDLVPR